MCCNSRCAPLFLLANGLAIVNEQPTHVMSELLIERDTSSGIDPAAQQYDRVHYLTSGSLRR